MGASCSSGSNSSVPDDKPPSMRMGAATVSQALIDLLGPTLVSSAGNVPTSTALAGKSIALYFSAHWCPPCRSFTPALAAAYKKHLKGRGLEVIFISSDRDPAGFRSYFAEQPWLALPFSDRQRKAALGTKYGVSGIPTLVLIDGEGKLIASDGRAKVMSDPTGKWVPRALQAAPAAESKKLEPTQLSTATTPVPTTTGLDGLLGTGGNQLLDTDGRTTIALADVVKDAPLVALYFSAHWCGPCRGFTPRLVSFAQALEKEGMRLPIIFGSSDRDEAAFQEYFSEMPWFAFPHGDPRIEELNSKYEVSGIPWLVVLDAQGNLVQNEADTDVPKGTQAYHDWLAKARKAAGKAVAGAPAA